MRKAAAVSGTLIPLGDRAVVPHDHDGVERGVQQ
jgi:hypothetical protein